MIACDASTRLRRRKHAMEPADPYGLLAALPAAPGPFPSALERRRGAAEDSRWELCPECLCPLQVRSMEFVCPDCGRVSEGPLEPEAPERPAARRGELLRAAPRLRIVGANSGWYQRDLDRTSATADSRETQRRTIMQELLAYNAAYCEKHRSSFPVNVLAAVAEAYGQVQQVCVKRSHMKQAILAALLMHMCVRHNFVRSNAEVARFMQLSKQGTARGDDFLRALRADGKIDVDVNADRLTPHTVAIFAMLGLAEAHADDLAPVAAGLLRRSHACDDATAHLQRAVCAVVRTALDKNIGTHSVLRSKTAAAAHEVLRRAGARTTLDAVVERCGIRKNTIVRFTGELLAFHSHFVPVYQEYRLDCRR